MKIKVLGAAGGEVTGSAYYVQTKQASVLVDCGLFQGGKKSEALNRPPPTPKQKIDGVLLTRFSAIAPCKPRVVLTRGGQCRDRVGRGVEHHCRIIHDSGNPVHCGNAGSPDRRCPGRGFEEAVRERDREPRKYSSRIGLIG